MTRVLSVTDEAFPIAGAFTISRGSKTQADVIVCSISQDGETGCGECVPYKRYGETLASVREEIAAANQAIVSGASREDLLRVMKPGAARNAVDCALWDVEAKLSGVRVSARLGLRALQPLTTAYTLSLDTPEKMAEQAAKNAARPLLKVKLGGDDDIARMRAITAAAPESRLIVDANEGWTEQNLEINLAAAAECRVALIEQPLPADDDDALATIKRVVPICADESLHVSSDLEALRSRYDVVNIKLDKSGGLTEGVALHRRARELGFGVMVGCMVGTSLAMAPALLLAQDAEFVDLDGPLLLARDREPGLLYEGSLVYPPQPQLWG